MSIRPHIATKYDVVFDETPYSADDFIRLLRRIQTDFAEDVICWEGDGREDDFELSADELERLLASGKTADDDELDVFIAYLLEHRDKNIDYIKIQLY